MTKTGSQKLKLNWWKPLRRTSRERREPGPSCQAQPTRGEGREGFYNESAFSISYVTNIQSMQTGTLEALKLDLATILSPCPLHPLQNTWLQWWGILQIHWEEKKSKKKLKYPIYPGQPVGSQSINSFFTLLFITLIKIHFFLCTPKIFWTTKDRKAKQKRQYTVLQGLAGDYRPFLSSSKTFSHFGQNFSGSAEVEQDGTSRASLWSGKYQKMK